MMTEKQLICTTCPIGCAITVSGAGQTVAAVTGNQCQRGEVYARNEYLHPVRILTSTVKVTGGAAPQVSVRSSQPVPRELLLECMKQIKAVRVTAPVTLHEIIIPRILGTDVDIIATGIVDPSPRD